QRGPPLRRSGKRRIKSNRSSTTWIESDGMTHDVTLVLATLGVRAGGRRVANALPGGAEIDKLLKGIPQHGNVLGRPAAPTTLVEYVDLQCPFCQEFETQAMPALIKLYVRTGKTKVELRPVAF